MEHAGRWLPEGVGVERADDGVYLRGGEYDGYYFGDVPDLLAFVRRVYPDLQPRHHAE